MLNIILTYPINTLLPSIQSILLFSLNHLHLYIASLLLPPLTLVHQSILLYIYIQLLYQSLYTHTYPPESFLLIHPPILSPYVYILYMTLYFPFIIHIYMLYTSSMRIYLFFLYMNRCGNPTVLGGLLYVSISIYLHFISSIQSLLLILSLSHCIVKGLLIFGVYKRYNCV